MGNRIFLKQIFHFFRDFFWHSEKKNLARFIFLIIFSLTIVTVVLTTYFAAWNALFWTALNTLNAALFVQQMLIFSLLITADLTVTALQKYLQESLIVKWREWLTQKYIHQYTAVSQRNYLKLVRGFKQVDNPEQRIQEDINKFVNHAVGHVFNLVKSTLKFVTFIAALWVVGGSLSLSFLGLSLTIPGYLVWVALIFSALASFLTHQLGSRLTEIHQQAEIKEAKFRHSMHENHQHAENIALEGAENFYQKTHQNRLRKMIHLAYKKIILETKLTGFKKLYAVIASFFPYLVSAPIYFSGLITIGQMMQIGFFFSEINSALNWFIKSYETLASFKASTQRIMELHQAFETQDSAPPPFIIQRNYSSSTDILIDKLDIFKPEEHTPIVTNLSLAFVHGQHTLIQGPTASGKSTLFKVLSGSWTLGRGSIELPEDANIMCLPQFITIPARLTLRQIIAYPNSADSFSEAEYNELCQLIPVLSHKQQQLDSKKIDWRQTLSGGEKQQLAFARALLQKPQWLLLDETSASLDSKTETNMYAILKQKLPDTTIISISHKEHLQSLHSRVLDFSAYKSA